MKRILLAMGLLLAAWTAQASQEKVKNDTLVVTTTPQMHCANCEQKIKQHIRFVKGVKRIVTSVPRQTVTIIYDPSKSVPADFAAAFRKIGYEIAPAKP